MSTNPTVALQLLRIRNEREALIAQMNRHIKNQDMWRFSEVEVRLRTLNNRIANGLRAVPDTERRAAIAEQLGLSDETLSWMGVTK